MPTSLPQQARRSHCSNAPFILECEVDGRPTAVPEEKEVKLEEMKSKDIWSMVFNRGVELVEPGRTWRQKKTMWWSPTIQMKLLTKVVPYVEKFDKSHGHLIY